MTARVIRPATILKAYFSRASTATYIGSDGLLKTAAVNERRPNYVAGVHDGWVYEPAAATNQLLHSRADTTTGWTRGPNLTRVGSSTAPDGTATATTYSVASVGNAFVGQVVARAASTTYTISLWARLVSGSSPTIGALIAVDHDTDGVSGTLERTTLNFAGLSLTSTWKRFSLTFTNVAAIASGSTYLCTDFNTGVQIAIWGAQLEVGVAASSYIPTTTAAASRAAEVSNNATRELVSTNAVETVPLWSAGTAYTLGQQVRRDTTQRIYENQLAGTNAEVPETVASTRWLDVAPTNTMAMFDQEVGSITKATNSIDVVLRPGAISGLGLQELSNANSVHVVMRETPGGTVVLDTWIDLEYAQIMDHYDWAYLPYEARTDALLVALPEFPNCELTVNIVGSGEVGCGLLLVGEDVELGYSEWGLSLGRKNFSTFQEVRGRTKVVKGTSARKMDTKVWVPAIGRAKFERLLKEVKDTACLWIGEDGPGYETTCVYGIYRDYTLVLSTVEEDLLNLQVEGFP